MKRPTVKKIRRAAKRRQPLRYGFIKNVSAGMMLLPWGEPISREKSIFGWRKARPDVAPF
jgi:hypothetical protein